MKYLLLFSLVFIFSPICMLAQNHQKSPSHTIKGTLIDENSQDPLEFGTISLYSLPDTLLIDGTITGNKGEFILNADPGQYMLQAQFIAYEVKTLPNIQLNLAKNILDLGKIYMTTDVQQLEEIVVQGDRNQLQLELDKRVFNIGQNINNVGANATEILDNIPSISVDVEGTVTLRGNSNVRILVNGKPSGLVGISDQDGLRQLQGDIIERIEVITNPSARYDAEGSAGIINIVLKKERRKGFNGAFTANLGIPSNYGFSGNANYRQGKFNLSGSYGINYRKNPGGGFTDRTSFTNSTVHSYIDNDRVRSGTSHNFRLGLDYNLNENNTISVFSTIRISDENNVTNLTYFDRDVDMVLFNHDFRKDSETEDDDNLEYQLSYVRTMKGKKGHELTAQFQYRDNKEIERSSIGESDLLLNESLAEYQRSDNTQGDKNVLMQVDYTRPMKDKRKFEAGYRGTIREISSDYLVLELDANGEFIPIEEIFEDLNFSNLFTYEEDVHAAYAIFENKAQRWGYQVGMRVEQTYITTFQREGSISNKKAYTNAFPSAFISYKVNKEKSVQASYSRRLRRPRFRSLNPFSSFSDPRNIRTGNTDLDPAYTNSFELGFLSNYEKSSIYLGGYYRNTTQVINRISVPGVFAGQPSTITTPVNIGTENSIGIEGNFSFDPNKKLNISGNANFYRAMTEGTYEGQELNRDVITASFRLNTKLKFKKINVQLSGNYRAPQNTIQGRRKSFYSLDFGANRDVLHGKGTFNLSIRDIFNSRKYRASLVTDVLLEDREFQWRSRQARLSFTYRINQKKKRTRQNRRIDEGNDDF